MRNDKMVPVIVVRQTSGSSKVQKNPNFPRPCYSIECTDRPTNRFVKVSEERSAFEYQLQLRWKMPQTGPKKMGSCFFWLLNSFFRYGNLVNKHNTKLIGRFLPLFTVFHTSQVFQDFWTIQPYEKTSAESYRAYRGPPFAGHLRLQRPQGLEDYLLSASCLMELNSFAQRHAQKFEDVGPCSPRHDAWGLP